MAWTQADLDALDAAIKQGVRSVQFADKSVTYHSIDDMLKLRGVIRGEVLSESGGEPQIRQFRIYVRDGF